MSELELPMNLVSAADGDDADGVRRCPVAGGRRTWMAGLPLVVEDLAQRWSLEIGRPFQPGGVASWVAPARNAAGEHVVVKVGWRHDEALHEPDGLRAWHGDGAVMLLDALEIGDSSALLLEACEPGTALSQLQPAEEQDAVVAGLLRRLWIEPASGHPFRRLGGMCDRWAGEYEQRYTATVGGPRLDPGLSRAGTELFRSLPPTARRVVLLVTDLHPGNVLAAGREPWLAIDPKPYVGDPAYDPIQHMLNAPDRLSVDPVGFARRMAALVDVDAERLRQWLFARCVLESLDQPHLMGAAVALAP